MRTPINGKMEKHSADELQCFQWKGGANDYLDYDLARDDALMPLIHPLCGFPYLDASNGSSINFQIREPGHEF